MQLREAVERVRGFRYMAEKLDIQSGLGRRYLYAVEKMKNREDVMAELGKVEQVLRLLEKPVFVEAGEKIRVKLMQVRDVRGTVKHINDGCVLDDLELFELKSFALTAAELRELTDGFDIVDIPAMDGVLRILDPENTRVPNFYICDAYSVELADLRAEIKRRRQQGEAETVLEDLYFRSVELEDGIREELSEQIKAYRQDIALALEMVARLDIWMAKAEQARDMGLCKPDIRCEAEMETDYCGLFNPQLREILRQSGKEFQPVDVSVQPYATLITGANMAGKTVLLKSVALAQYLVQFGFYVPAQKAVVTLVDAVLTSIGDEQDELNGLSSFAAEMLRINEIIRQVKAGKRVLVLIDELARTTNPVEGKAIVNGVLEIFTENRTGALVTTHYSGIKAHCRKLRVKGFIEEKVQGNLTLKNINEFIDYSLVEDNESVVPQEAIRIAAMLNVDPDLLDRAGRYLEE